jgi:hypothetical protein
VLGVWPDTQNGGRLMIDYSLRAQGPLFDGQLARAVKPFLNQASYDVARHGQDIVWHRGRRAFQTWTNGWGGSLITERRSEGWVTHDRVIYGAWLEGVGSRNQTTRFKGYWSFRKAQQELNSKTPQIVQRSLKKSTLGKLMGS